MSYEKEINDKAQELGQKYFPNHLNIWARPNVEAHHVECACIEMYEYVKNKMLEKACVFLRKELMDNRDNFGYPVVSTFDTITLNEFIEEFKKAIK